MRLFCDEKAIPTTEAAKAQDAQQNAQWRVDNCVWCPQKLGQQRKSNERIALNKKRICKKRGVTKLVAPQCVACSTEGKREFPFSLQKEMRDFASKTYEKAKRSIPCKIGEKS